MRNEVGKQRTEGRVVGADGGDEDDSERSGWVVAGDDSGGDLKW